MSLPSEVNLSAHSFVFSVNPGRMSMLRRAFRERGLSLPVPVPPIVLPTPTRAGEPRAYSALALNFIEVLLGAYRAGLPYVVLFEDDAFPCLNPADRLSDLLRQHPLPPDCGILCLGDMNGASKVRGSQTLLLRDCAPVYTPLVPARAENKGSHALLVFRHAFLPFVQAIVENGVTDLAVSRICRYSPLRAYGLFRMPLFLQQLSPSSFRSPELFADRGATCAAPELFPPCRFLTQFSLDQPVHRFFIFSNAPGKNLSSFFPGEDDVAVLLNRAVDEPALPRSCRRILLCRRNAAALPNSSSAWFLPAGQELALSSAWEDFLLPQDSDLAAERPWFKAYRASGFIPSTGWIAYHLLRQDFPQAEIVLVDFEPGGENGCYKWPRHNWQQEELDYASASVTRLRLRP